jgi:hypothetical protein
MNSERRCIRRERPEEISYIYFQPEGGGIVLNASERGLAFHAATAVRQQGPVRLSVSPNPNQLIGLTAEIVWMDQTRKSGGLRFTELTEDTRNQISRWLTPTGETETPDRKLALPSCLPPEETDSCSGPRNSGPGLLSPSPVSQNASPTFTNVDGISAPASLGFSTKALWPETFSQEKLAAFSKPRLLRGLATGFLALVFVSAPILFLQNFRSGLGDLLIHAGMRLKGKNYSPLDASPSTPVPISNPDQGAKSSVPEPTPEIPVTETQSQLDPPAAAPTNPQTADLVEPKFAHHQNSPQHSADPHFRATRSPLARQLWSAIGAGDSSAEVALAELYLKGDGVPKNCEQALVLLRVASKNGNVQAVQRLKKLGKNACR